MLFDDDSLIAGAGQGVFLRPDQHGIFYRKNIVMCFYNMVTLSNEQVLELSSSNYLMKVRNGYIDARKFESFNLGRFANQGGLPPGLKAPGKRPAIVVQPSWQGSKRVDNIAIAFLCYAWGRGRIGSEH